MHQRGKLASSRRRAAFHAAVVCMGLCAFAGSAGTARAQAELPREERIKAVLVFKILKFVMWPSVALPAKEPLVICTTVDSAIGDALFAAEGRQIDGHPLQQRRLSAMSAVDLKGCHVVYLPAAQRDWLGIARALRGRPVLTVGDGPDFARKGGVIGLVRGENRVGFEISLKAAKEGGLDIGAPLLELANLVD